MPLPAAVLSALVIAGSPLPPADPPAAHRSRLAHGAPDDGRTAAGPVLPQRAQATAPAAREIAVALTPGTPPPVIALVPGEAVRLVIHGRPGTQLHLHGYDIEARAGDDGVAVIELDARHAGRFPVVTHDGDALLGTRETAAFYLEITAP